MITVGRRELVKSPDGSWGVVSEAFARYAPTGIPAGLVSTVRAAKAARESKPPQAIDIGFQLITSGRWVLCNLYVIKGRKCDPYINKKTKKECTYMPFRVPITVVEIRQANWPDGTVIQVRHSQAGMRIVHPGEDKGKVSPYRSAMAGQELDRRFGKATALKIAGLIGI